jgi:hypothetical protein
LSIVAGVKQQLNMEFETARSIQAFKDILCERYGTSDFMWMSQDWQPRLAYLHTFKTNPQKLKVDVLKCPRLQHVIEEVKYNVSCFLFLPVFVRKDKLKLLFSL